MRLRRLEFTGIGSFADTMEIDFDALGSAGMFLVEGPTGSGKSTILDAIVFALYGGVAGSASDPVRLDSHVRDRKIEPYVELDFSCGQDTYRIRRVPQHERDKRRGGGTMRDEGSVSLLRIEPDEASISHKAKEVGDWVIETVGLTKQQFVSTIVLAQGEFAAFLDADTAARAQILEKVFGTQFYKHVEDQLATMRKAAVDRRVAAQRAVEEVIHRCLGVLGITEATDPGAAIDERAGELLAELGAAKELLTAAEDRRELAHSRYAAAETLRQQQQRKQALLVRQAALQDDDDRVAEARKALSAHERAVPAVAAIEAWRRACDEHIAAQEGASEAAASLRVAGGGPASPEAVVALADLLGQLRTPALLETELPRLRARELDAGERARLAQERAAATTAEQMAVAAELAQIQKERLDEAGPRTALAAAQVQQAALEEKAARWQAVTDSQPALDAAVVELSSAARDLQAAQRVAQDAGDALAQDQAAELATRLVDGEPCLVCGATEHPAPARPPATAPMLDLPAAQAAADAARTRWQEAKAGVDRLEGRLSQLRQGLTDEPQVLARSLREARRDIEALQNQIEAATAQAHKREVLAAESMAVQARVGEHRVTAERAIAEHSAAKAAWESAQAQVEAAAGDHATVRDRLATVTKVHAAMTTAVGCDAKRAAAEQTKARAEALLTATLAGVGLPDVPAVEAALRDDDEAERMRADVTAHDRAVDEVRGALLELERVDLADAPDLTALADELEVCTQQAQLAHERVVRSQHVLGELTPLRDQLAQRSEEQRRVRDETAGVIRMAELAAAARGEVMHRVRLSSFVLMRRFEAVVDAANDRLDAISEGRYQLRVETNGLNNRGQAGLDLVIEDQRTERCRATKSLSGGERFYVSLALALGLADVVRSESGGVQLGTLFIDEGFGSLDAEVLEEVMDMLEQVRAGEDRVIGLVSHVDLLKARIDPRISVRRDPQRPGVSTVEVHV